MFTVTLDYLENGKVMTCDIIHESLADALDCAGQYVFIGECQAVFVTDAFGEIVYCYETGFENAYQKADSKAQVLAGLVSINPYPTNR